MYFGQVHKEDDSTWPGIAYRQGLTMRERGYGGTTRVYIEGERTITTILGTAWMSKELFSMQQGSGSDAKVAT